MDKPATYRIRLESELDPSWGERFEGMHLSHQDGESLLEGLVTDQAELHGLLSRVRDMGLVLVSVQRLASR